VNENTKPETSTTIEFRIDEMKNHGGEHKWQLLVQGKAAARLEPEA
jgi:hypothetical protein